MCAPSLTLPASGPRGTVTAEALVYVLLYRFYTKIMELCFGFHFLPQ